LTSSPALIHINHETQKETEETPDHGGGLHARQPQVKKVYHRKRLKRTGINEDGCPFCMYRFFHPHPLSAAEIPIFGDFTGADSTISLYPE